MKFKVLYAFNLLLLVSTCGKLESNPYAVQFEDNERNLTQKQLAHLERVLQQQPDKETITIAFITDSQRSLDEFTDGIEHIRKNDNIDLVFHGGDITDYGLNAEYKKMGAVLRKLDVPFFTAFGNHDALGLGTSSYETMFGALDYSFEAWGHKFIFFNGNYWEFKIQSGEAPNFDFLESELSDSNSAQSIFIISHMGPFHEEFGEENAIRYHNILIADDRIKLSVHGHGHRRAFGELYGTGFNYLMVDDVRDKNYDLIHINKDGSFTTETVHF